MDACVRFDSQQQGVLDPKGAKIYSVGAEIVLPANCWHKEGDVYFSAIRMTQVQPLFLGSAGETTEVNFSVFDNDGLECLDRWNGKKTSWYGHFNKKCTKKYSNAGNIPYVIFTAKS